MHKKLLITLLSVILILNACSVLNQKLGNEPPQPKLTADGKQIKIYQSSYCWGSKCVDYIGPNEMLKDKEKDKIKGNTTISIQFEGKQPTELGLAIFNQDEITHETITDNQFKAPDTKGIYYFNLSANWLRDKDKRITEGSSSYAFAIEVLD
ncbi:hypothetical protein [Paenibacillus sediminis]|uniref:Lipoprotein n=1 Tax=Paenibacillus sediminis TaxID=664909 RepID=A0ABS4H800_9BACL|nr:hypothetical protein [Paenibacillus sediminis]MBP1938660.1 hypothetical protein [Paenibacillus sediminis]